MWSRLPLLVSCIAVVVVLLLSWPALFEPFAGPCHRVLTDAQYLKHMIPHHQVAVDVSVQHAKHTPDVALAKVLRELIWTQNYEIVLMQTVLRRPMVNMTAPPAAGAQHRPPCRPLIETTMSREFPNTVGLSTAKCDPLFFDPAAHAAHMGHMGRMTDRAYYDHMIPHHQVAVDMSKVLLKNTRSDFMMQLAYRIIRAQEGEIKLLHDMRAAGARAER